MTALILDGGLQSALAAVRSLGARGIRVIAASERASAMALHSKFASRSVVYPSPLDEPTAFVAWIKEISATEKDGVVVYPFSDQTLLLLSRHRSEFPSGVHVVLPQEASVETACDKARTLELARSLNVPMPQTEFPMSEKEIAETKLSFPLIVKPRHSCVWRDGHAVWGSASSVSTPAEAKAFAERTFERSGEWPILQRKLEGDEIGAFFLYDHGVARWTFGHRRLRSLNPGGGASSLRESFVLPDDVLDQSKKLLDALAWHGVAMVEWKRDVSDGVYKLMEINGRFWGSLALAGYAGVDFAFGQYELARTGIVSEQPPFKAGVRSRYFLNDVRHLLKSMRSGSALEALRHFRAQTGQTFYDVESWTDPMPTLWQFIDLAFRKPLPV